MLTELDDLTFEVNLCYKSTVEPFVTPLSDHCVGHVLGMSFVLVPATCILLLRTKCQSIILIYTGMSNLNLGKLMTM